MRPPGRRQGAGAGVFAPGCRGAPAAPRRQPGGDLSRPERESRASSCAICAAHAAAIVSRAAGGSVARTGARPHGAAESVRPPCAHCTTPRARTPSERAGRRVAMEPILSLQAQLIARRRAVLDSRAPDRDETDALHRDLLGRCPFTLTAGQLAVLEEMRADMARGVPMRRLLQGDVGSGKTALGLYACMAAARPVGQAAFMAPDRAPGRAALPRRATSARTRRRSRRAVDRFAAGERSGAASTSALERRHGPGGLRNARAVQRVGALRSGCWLCVVDEQHRFGVEQRRKLLDKGREVHALLMTATPIPRSLALTTYGDLDVSLLSESPPGRGSDRDALAATRARMRALVKPIEERLEQRGRAGLLGRAPHRFDDETSGRTGEAAPNSASNSSASYAARAPRHRAGARAHPRRGARAKRTRALSQSRSRSRLLVATTVIEVGVDVPEATVMVIEAAERLGLRPAAPAARPRRAQPPAELVLSCSGKRRARPSASSCSSAPATGSRSPRRTSWPRAAWATWSACGRRATTPRASTTPSATSSCLQDAPATLLDEHPELCHEPTWVPFDAKQDA